MEFTEKIIEILRKSKYKKQKNNFSKIENDFYKVINFQNGQFGNYFYVNIAAHPVGLPLLQADNLIIPVSPKEYECIFRFRIEQIIDNEVLPKKGLGFSGDDDLNQIAEIIPLHIEKWFTSVCSFQRIFQYDDSKLIKLINCVPILKDKALNLLKLYAAIKLKNITVVTSCFEKYKNIAVPGIDLTAVDKYISKMIDVVNESN